MSRHRVHGTAPLALFIALALVWVAVPSGAQSIAHVGEFSVDVNNPPGAVTLQLGANTSLQMTKMPADTVMSQQNAAQKESPGLEYYTATGPLTLGQWHAVMGFHHPAAAWRAGSDSTPIEGLSFDDIAGAKGFVELLNIQQRKAGGELTFIVPTESEWLAATSDGVAGYRLTAMRMNPAFKTTMLSIGSEAACTTGNAVSFSCGQTATAALSVSDCTLTDGSYADLYAFTGTAGQQVTIDLTSTAFDAYLILFDGSGNSLTFDDDSGTGLNAQIIYTLPSSGTYIIAANSLSPGMTGFYSLHLTCSAGNSCSTSHISCGGSASGSLSASDCQLTDGSRADFFTFSGTSGQTVTIDMTSAAFDTYLILLDPVGTAVAHDDDTGDGLNARLTYTLTSTGTWTIIANSLLPGVSGTYNVSLACGTNGACSPNANTACVLNSRFRVTVRYRGGFDNGAADTNALVKPVSGFGNPAYETAFFYFNDSNNIELMLKMLDQGNTNGAGQPTIAVLFGTATPLRVELTIYDTLRGTTKTYTSDYSQMKGATDFTAFVK